MSDDHDDWMTECEERGEHKRVRDWGDGYWLCDECGAEWQEDEDE